MQDNPNNNLEGEEFELDDLEGGFSSLSSIFSDRDNVSPSKIAFDIDETDSPKIPEAASPSEEEPEDDDIAPPIISRENQKPDEKEDVAPIFEESTEEDFAEDLINEEDSINEEDLESPADVPSPAFGTLADREPGPTIGDIPTPFDALSEDDLNKNEEDKDVAGDEEIVEERELEPELEPEPEPEPEREPEKVEVDEDSKEVVVVGSGFFASIKAKMAAARELDAADKEQVSSTGFFALLGKKKAEKGEEDLAGIDSSKPSLLESLKASKRSKQVQEDKPTGDFEKLLTPLSGADLTLLQQELEQEEPIFVQLKQAKRQANLRQAAGFIVGALVLICFGAVVGKEYLTVTLAGAPIPDWVPLNGQVQSLSIADLVGGIIFGLGLILPMVAVFAVAEAVAVLWRSLAFGRLLPLVEAIIAAICGIGIFICLIEQNITFATVLAATWIIVRVLMAKIIRRSG